MTRTRRSSTSNLGRATRRAYPEATGSRGGATGYATGRSNGIISLQRDGDRDRHGNRDGIGHGSIHGSRRGGGHHDNSFGRRFGLHFGNGGDRDFHLGLSYFEPHYDRYSYCHPYRHYHRRYSHGLRYPYFGYGSSFIGFGSYGYYPSRYYYDPYPVTSYYYPSTTVIYNDPSVEQFYDGDLYRNDTAPLSVPPGGTTPGAVGGEYEATQNAQDEVEQGEPQSEPTLVDQGNASFHSGDYEAAVRYYVAAVLANDRDEVARLFYGLAQMALSDYDLAALGMRRALEIEPELITRPIDLRSIYPDLATFERHLERLRRYVGAQPEDRNGLFLLGYVYYASVQPENAVSVLRSLTDLDPEDKLAVEIRDAAASVVQRKAAEGPKK